jgi:hypothetical protein
MKAQYLILSADTYRMQNNETGEYNDGLNIWYIPENDLTNIDNEARNNNISKGVKPAQASFPIETSKKLFDVPGVYEFTVRMETVSKKNDFGSKMLQTIRPIDIDYVGNVKLEIAKPKAYSHEAGYGQVGFCITCFMPIILCLRINHRRKKASIRRRV